MRIPLLIVACSWPGLATADGPMPPRVVSAWAAGPMEARVAFDRPVDPSIAAGAVGRTIGFGEGAKAGAPSAGRPGGDRGSLRIAAARLVDDGRTLVLVTDPHPRESTYAMALPGVKAPGDPGPGSTGDASYTLGGVEVTWAEGEAKGAKPAWSGWWPHVEPSVARELTAGSAEHDRLWPMTARAGLLTLRAFVALPQGESAVALDAGAPFEATLGTEAAKSVAASPTSHRATLKAESTGEAIELSMALRTGGGGPIRLKVAATDARNPAGGPIPRPAFVLPWAPPTPATAPPPTAPPELLTGGDPGRGEVVFYGEQAKCAACHQVRGKGGLVGPDLTDLAGRDRAWIYQNIVEPSATIHPDYVSYTVALKDGRVAMGVVRAEGADALKVADIDAKLTVIPRAEVEEIRPSTSSIMPVGLLGAIGEDRTRDLLAFLTAPGPRR